MIRGFIRAPVAVLVIALTGCPPTPVTLKTVVLSPTDVSYGYQYNHSWSWECDVPQGLPTYGTGPGPVSSGETLVGWYDYFIPGAQPLPCNNAYQYITRGHVQFDLSQFDAIADATLAFSVDSSESQTLGPMDQPPQSYATVLGMSTGQAQGDNGPYWWPYDNDVALGGCGALLGCSIDVSNQANQWTHQQHFNYGFILAGPKLSLDNSVPQDNNAQQTWYGNFKLTVLYNPALNPRAPQ
jgi:hypothetical protein